MKFDIVKVIFFIRMILWAAAVGVTVYWIRFSFQLYGEGYIDENQYAAAFRPVFSKSLLVTAIILGICYLLRYISDRIKRKEKYET